MEPMYDVNKVENTATIEELKILHTVGMRLVHVDVPYELARRDALIYELARDLAMRILTE